MGLLLFWEFEIDTWFLAQLWTSLKSKREGLER